MTTLRRLDVRRYVTPLREGGSLPAIVEGCDDGLYVLKFRGAGQGPKVLIAELVAGELARGIGLPIPEIVFMDLDPDIARTEPDPEIQALVRASAGLNLAFDFLPGAVMFDPVAVKPDAALASRIVWFDALVCNVDRTPRNTNLLVWHGAVKLIDHGAALYFHHDRARVLEHSHDPFVRVKDHVLLPFAGELERADDELSKRLTPALLERVAGAIPDSWLDADTEAHRASYRDFLAQRLAGRHLFLQEALRARSLLV